MTARPPLTLLYVPGDRPGRIDAALGSAADVVIVDLEDAVLPSHKDGARGHAADALARAARAGRLVQVRVNAQGSDWWSDDVAMVAALPVEVSVRIPKCVDAAVVRSAAESLPGRALHLLVESALGLERAHDLATADGAVAGIGLGEADLRSDLGVTSEDGLLYARGRLVATAAAAGLPPPSMSVYADVRDTEGLRRSCEVGRALGFLGRSAIHPSQLGVIAAVFRPSPAEVERAREVLAAAEAAGADGRGAVALNDGRFVDEALVRQARRVVALASTDEPLP